MTTGGCRVVSPSAIQRNCAPSLIDPRPGVSNKVNAENLPVSLRLRQRVRASSGPDRFLPNSPRGESCGVAWGTTVSSPSSRLPGPSRVVRDVVLIHAVSRLGVARGQPLSPVTEATAGASVT
jgi:hypothetical protein